MNKKIVYLMSIMFFTLIGFIFTPNIVKADINGLTVTPLVGDSDVSDKFQIIGKSDATRTLKISLANFGTRNLKLHVVPTNATTSMDGKIVFTDNNIKAGQYGLKYAFADMTKGQTVYLKTQTTKDLSFKIKLPADKIDHLIMGGFNIYDKQVNGTATIPVWITGNNEPVGGIVTLHNLSLDVIRMKPHIIVNLQNKEPGMMKNVIVHTTVKRKSWLDRFNLGDKTMTADLTYPKVAPNSKIPVDFDQNTTPIKAGKYVVKGAARSGKATWTFHKTYTITQDQANDINKRCKGLIYNKTTTYILIVCVLVSLIFLIFWAIWYSGRS